MLDDPRACDDFLFARRGGERLPTMTIKWEQDADGLEGFVGTDETGQWWGRVDVGAEPLGPFESKDAAIEAYQDADPDEQYLRRLMREVYLAEPPDGWQERLAELFRERFGDGDG